MTRQLTIREKLNPVRYSTAMLLFLTACLFYTQHYPVGLLQNKLLDSNYMVQQMQGDFSRQIAYLLLGAVGVFGYRHAAQQRRLTPDRHLLIPLCLLMGWCLLSLFWSGIPFTAAKRYLVILLMLSASIGLVLSWTREQLVKFVALSSAIYISIGLLLEIQKGFFRPLSSIYRFSGTLTANEIGYMCMALVLSAGCMTQTEKVRKQVLLYRALVAYGFGLLLLTRSRGALVAVILSFILYFFIALDFRKKFLAALLVGSGVLTLVISGVLSNLFGTLNRSGEGSDDLTGRIPLWKELMEYVDKKPWLGSGFDSFWTTSTMDDIFHHQHWNVNQAHSSYVEAMLTIGIIGMVFHVAVLLVGTVEGLRLFRKTRDIAFFLSASFCLIYIAGGGLEALLIIKPSIVTFYVILFLCVTLASGEQAHCRPVVTVRKPLQPRESRFSHTQKGRVPWSVSAR